MPLDCTVVITTKDRWTELYFALKSVSSQSCRPNCIVVDDGSHMPPPPDLVADHPEFEFHRNGKPLGIVRARNVVAKMISTSVIASLDDDAVYADAMVLEDALKLIDLPDVAAVSIPHKNILAGKEHPIDQHPEAGMVPLFVGCSYLVKRDAFNELGGFRDAFIRQGEEDDFCLRLAYARLRVAQLDRIGVIHRPSTVRDEAMISFYRVRNRLLMAIFNYGLPTLALFILREILVLAGDIIAGRAGTADLRGFAQGLFDGVRKWDLRRVIPFSVVASYTQFKKRASKP